MGGRGFAPKDPEKRAGHVSKADRNGLRVIHATPIAQPDLPSFDLQVEVDGELVAQEFAWPERTRSWWRMWGESPLSAEYTQTDWDFLLDTALVHAKFWQGNSSVAAELRLRVAKFGATPEDRARLRITFAQADEAEGKVCAPKGGGSRARRGPLKSAPLAAPDAADEPEAPESDAG